MAKATTLDQTQTPEHQRLQEAESRQANWKRWGPYLSERQWGTVREDYSEWGDSWGSFPHDHARSRAYRWGEDGLMGFTDRQCRLCFSVALWNGNDGILKERLFGLTGPEGNHGEDVKERYYYLDSTPTHSYAKALYLYPQSEYPYDKLVAENRKRGKDQLEYEIEDTGAFDGDKYFDVQTEYAKASPDDVLIRITVTNNGPKTAPVEVLPTLLYRNTWVWGCEHEGCTLKPDMRIAKDGSVRCEHETLGVFHLEAAPGPDGAAPELMFTENHTNRERLFGGESVGVYVKDAFHRYVVEGEKKAINPKQFGTKAAARYKLSLEPGESQTIELRLSHESVRPEQAFGQGFEDVFNQRVQEADAFYDTVISEKTSDENRTISRQAYAGLMWTKQFYHYIVGSWLNGDPDTVPPPEGRKQGRNRDWQHMFSRDILSMPDKWEYPWFAAWDLAFHTLPISRIDPAFAKYQLEVMLREWYMHPNGQIPAYEFNFSDVNPPVHAWAVWRVYKMTAPRGKRDRRFLASCFQKLLLNFTWWVNRKDPEGNHLFAGGFLGLDNIGVFDRNMPLPDGQELVQSDGTAWMAFYCLTMLAMALELADSDAPEAEAYEDMASKFFEHFVHIADAINDLGGMGLWDQKDGIYYDELRADGQCMPIRVRSLVGLMPLIAVEVLKSEKIRRLKGFQKRARWFVDNRPDLESKISLMLGDEAPEGRPGRLLLAMTTPDRLHRVVEKILDETEFLSDFGVRSLSKYHEQHPYTLQLQGQAMSVRYTPGESDSGMFGGNSNWRGPIWLPINYLLVEALQRYGYFLGDANKVECPSGSGNWVTLTDAAAEIQRRLAKLCRPDEKGRVLFYEYFHGDTGRGLGASHQTGWTALVANCIEDLV